MSHQQGPIDEQAVAKLILENDFKNLHEKHRVEIYKDVCEKCGLDPSTHPFEFIELNGKLTLYATKRATDQLRRVHGVSIRITERMVDEDAGIVSITAMATTPNGRTDEAVGVVSIMEPDRWWEWGDKKGQKVWHDNPRKGKAQRGEDRANGVMKAETKAKRRATLSLLGLGLLDELEVQAIVDQDAERADRADQMRQEQAEAPKGVAGFAAALAPKEAPKAAPKAAPAAVEEPEEPAPIGAVLNRGWVMTTMLPRLTTLGLQVDDLAAAMAKAGVIEKGVPWNHWPTEVQTRIERWLDAKEETLAQDEAEAAAAAGSELHYEPDDAP